MKRTKVILPKYDKPTFALDSDFVVSALPDAMSNMLKQFKLIKWNHSFFFSPQKRIFLGKPDGWDHCKDLLTRAPQLLLHRFNRNTKNLMEFVLISGGWLELLRKNVKLTHNSTPAGKRKVCDMILFIGGPVDWRAWETWMGDIGYRGRSCVTKVEGGCVGLESE